MSPIVSAQDQVKLSADASLVQQQHCSVNDALPTPPSHRIACLPKLDQSQFSAIDQAWMQRAFDLAQQAAELGEIPVGAVIVHANAEVGFGFNQPIAQHDPTAHAEIQALRMACHHFQNYRLPENATLYVTLEPCTMCVGALVHARIARVVFATTEPKAGALVSARQLLKDGYFNHHFHYEQGCLQQLCAQQLSDFFKQRRLAKKSQRNNNLE